MKLRKIKDKYPFLLPGALILFIAVLIRTIYFIFEIKSPLFLYPIIDESEFIHTARIIVANNFSYPEHFWHPPLYSWFLAFFFKIGIELKGIVIFQQFLGVTGAVILFLGLKRLNTKAALITALIWAVYPVELFVETRFLSENLYIFLSICLLYQLTLFEISYRKIITVAVITSLLIITKSQFLLFLVFFLIYLVVVYKKLNKYAWLFLGASMLLPVIVSLNNTRKSGGNFIFISSNGPSNLYIGNSSDIKKTLNIRPYEWRKKFYPDLYKEAGIKFMVKDTSAETFYPYKLSGYLTAKTIRDNLNPLVPIKNGFFKTFGFLHSEETPRNYDLYVYKQFNPILDFTVWKFPFYFPLAILFYAALLYIIIKRRILFRQKPWFWLLVLIAVHALPSVIFFNAFRYRLVTVPLLLFFAVLFYAEYYRNLKLQLVNILLILVFGTQLTSALLIQKIPEFESFSTIGKAYLKLGKTERAGIWFKRAEQHKTDDFMLNDYDNYIGASVAKEKEGDLAGALNELNMAVEKNPGTDKAYIFRASIEYKLSDFNAALKDYNQAIALNKDNKSNLQTALFGRGIVKAKMNDNEGAISDLDTVISIFPEYTQAYTNRGIAKAKLGRYKEAIADFDKATELDPKDNRPYFNRAGAYAALSNFRMALKNLDEAVAMNPDYSQAYYMRGQVELQMSLPKAACSDFKKAYELGFSDAKQALETYCRD